MIFHLRELGWLRLGYLVNNKVFIHIEGVGLIIYFLPRILIVIFDWKREYESIYFEQRQNILHMKPVYMFLIRVVSIYPKPGSC